ncbi:MAG: hypothetical protein GY745_08885 [Actinomycetia bacterium]|nr:hypothetical protein [Actinomycetes bacterium]MCP4085148.1 hypothetical protein [Actinomycetes bacterium]
MTTNETSAIDNDVERSEGIVRVWGERGATLVEHTMLIGLIAVVCMSALSLFGDETGGLVEGSADSIVIAGGGTPP